MGKRAIEIADERMRVQTNRHLIGHGEGKDGGKGKGRRERGVEGGREGKGRTGQERKGKERKGKEGRKEGRKEGKKEERGGGNCRLPNLKKNVLLF